jgi:hypothetical protein
MNLDAHLHPSSTGSSPGKRSCPRVHKNAEPIGCTREEDALKALSEQQQALRAGQAEENFRSR